MTAEKIAVTLSEWDNADPESHPELRNEFLDTEAPSRQLVSRLQKSGIVLIEELRSGIRIKTKSHVGRLSIGNLEITVRPKIDGMPLLNLFRYAYGLRRLSFLPAADYGTRFDSFQDILIYQLVSEAKEIIARGMMRQYARLSEELHSPRGRIDIDMVACQTGRNRLSLPCTHFPRLYDWLPNQILLSGLKLAARLTSDISLAGAARRVAAMLADDVSSMRLDQTCFHLWHRYRNRLTRAYEPAVNLVRLLAESSGISFDASDQKLALPGFMFDMNRFFQALLSRFLRENLVGYKVQDERRLRGMMAYVPHMKLNKRRDPTLRPDFAVLKESKIVKLLDAKYRDLWNLGLPRAMLYQLAIYALSPQGGHEAVILYPTVDGDASDAKIQIRDPVRAAATASILQRPVDLLHLDSIIQERSTVRQQREKADYAHRLVGLDSN